MPKVRRSNTKILTQKLKEAAYKREQEQSSAPHPVDLPPTHPYPQAESVNQTSGRIEYTPQYPRVVYEETRSIWSDGSVTNIVRSNAKGNI